MPNTSGSSKKSTNNDSTERHSNKHNSSGCSERSGSSAGRSRARKRKRIELAKYSDDELESDFDDCNIEDAIAIEKKLRKIARSNELSDDEMRKLLQKFVKNEHILALVTLKAEDELAREKREAEHAILITDTPSIPKLTRARARELNRTPAIALPSLCDSGGPTEIASLIKDDLHSDEDDEEYTFKEEDFISDDDPNTTISDMDSNPRTPGTPLTQNEYDDSPVKLSADGCFKLPFDKQADLRIATRTRSKFCLQQTTIEDLQSEFVPPDVEHMDVQDAAELAANDEDWMQFLNDFSKPLSNTIMGDDDDPVNDPEYIAAEKVTVDAEELRDINISKKELTELVAELFEGLLNEGVSLESVELETPQKFLQNSTANDPPITPATNQNVTLQERVAITRHINFDGQQLNETNIETSNTTTNNCVISDATITSTNLTLQNDYSFQPHVMSTPSSINNASSNTTMIPIATVPQHHKASNMISLPEAAIKTEPELIAVRVPGQPNCFQLAKVVSAEEALGQQQQNSIDDDSNNDTRYTQPYDTNYTWRYISIKKHVYSEYMQKFENLKNATSLLTTQQLETTASGFTQAQHDLLQQQLRIHVQLLTQNFLQTYSHPDLWGWANKPEKMLNELKQRSETDASFNCWNLNAATELVAGWKAECAEDSEENREMMEFLNHEVERTNRNTRQIARFPPRIMERMLNSTVFMYPEYLPRVPFTQKNRERKYDVFAPAESHLLALGLEKHMTNGVKVSKKPVSLRRACDRISKDTIFGKTSRRIWDRIKVLRTADYYNPVKYFFEHGHPPPIECKLYTFCDNTVLPPKERFDELPLAWQKYVKEKKEKEIQAQEASRTNENNQVNSTEASATPSPRATKEACVSYLEFVREAVGEDIQLPDNFAEAVEPEYSSAAVLPTFNEGGAGTTTLVGEKQKKKRNREKILKRNKQESLTINVNYVFGADASTNFLNTSSTSHYSNSFAPPALLDSSYVTANNDSNHAASLASLANNSANTVFPALPASTTHQKTTQGYTVTEATPVVAYNYDLNSHTWQPVLESLNESSLYAVDKTQRKLTDFFTIETRGQSSCWEDLESNTSSTPPTKQASKKVHKGKFKKHKPRSAFILSHRQCHRSQKHRQARNLRKRCGSLLTSYRLHLQQQAQRFEHKPLLQYFYRQFKALDLYTDLLIELKMSCRNVANGVVSSGTATTNSSSPLSISKRSRLQPSDEESGNGRSRKVNRQEENFRNMLLPDNVEDANRKDAIYAFNFYEKVEEVLKSSSRPEDCKRFNYILKNFDPRREKVSQLYYKLERLFLPDYPELAQVFLTFLLPSEAAEIGKFFEHFMAENMTTFINKLNIYFHKQPAQIRKVFNCLSELAEEEDVTVKKIESRILPLLRGNKFLEDWFLQLFPEAPPPERLLPPPEHVNLKEAANNQSGEYLETILDLIDSPTQGQQPQKQNCQLRYINGRIFYGSRIMLPAKLSFMAQKYADDCQTGSAEHATNTISSSEGGCIHAIREHGEQRLLAASLAAASASTTDCSGSDDNDKSEEEDAAKDTTGEEENCGSSKFEACDEVTLRSHAVRLNPNYYGYTASTSAAAATSTANLGHNAQQAAHHHANTKRSSLNFSDDPKLSPRRPTTAATNSAQFNGKTTSVGALSAGAGVTQINYSSSAASVAANASNTHSLTVNREKRKSPTKKAGSNPSTNSNIKLSPTNSRQRCVYNVQPMVVIHEKNSAIACAKKLKSLIEYSSESEADIKAGIAIVAKAKHPLTPTAATIENSQSDLQNIVKIENSDDTELYPVQAEVSDLNLSESSPLKTFKMDIEIADEDRNVSVNVSQLNSPTQQHHIVSSTLIDSDEDCKLEIVATLATSNDEDVACCSTSTASFVNKPHDYRALSPPPAWTRDEDKIILVEMKLGSRNREDLFQRIKAKLPNRSSMEITGRHQFLIDFLSKLQGN